jgi:hypothetical protein
VSKLRVFSGSVAECFGCPSHATSPAGSLSREACVCESGFFGDGVTNCTLCGGCPAGQYRKNCGRTLKGECKTCDPGSYKTTAGSEACSLCDAGKFLPSSAATSGDACSDCPAGTYAVAGATSCITCSPGSYSNSSEASSCSLCIAGKASSVPGATSVSTCLECPNGTSSATGSSACSVCERKDVVDRDDGSISTTWSWTGTMCLSVLPGGATHIDALMEDPNVTECLNGPTSDWDRGACECHPQVLLK